MGALGSPTMQGNESPPPTEPLAVSLDDLVFGDDGLIPAIVQDCSSGSVLMLGFMSAETLTMTLQQKRTVFWSRSRQEIWRKGDTSGNYQVVRSVLYDCDGDALLVRVDQVGDGACHTGEYSCFYRNLEQ